MSNNKKVLIVTESENNILVNSLFEMRNQIIREGKCTAQDVNSLMQKIIKTPYNKKKHLMKRKEKDYATR